MAGNSWDRVKEIFREACERPVAERAAYVDDACGGDAELHTEVQSLLDAHEGAGSFLEVPAGEGETASIVAHPLPSTPLSEGSGSVIGRYKLLQLIGEGGFGSVYMAEQQEPVRRKVALKIIKLGMDTRQVIARFEAERQALALMDHPNIARVLDAGGTETGRPYFVMELVRGVPITEYCDQNNLSTRERLELFQSVCSAVQHAHQKGIIHRDLKPSNVMVTLHDGVPVPKVIDFGIAKATNQRLTEKTLFTEYHQFIGTPQYMSPEQAEMSGLDVDTRTDIYSLGVLLYELLTGTTPFDPERLRSLAYTEIHRMIREEDPHKPSTRVSTLGETATDTAKHRATDARTLRKTLSGDLDWIVMKALEKDRTRRYETANGLLLDIRRHLEHEPVLASPPQPIYRLRKLVRRHRTAVAVTGAIAAALIMGLTFATYGFVQANRERAIARREAESAEAINTFFNQMLASVDPRQAHLHSAFHGTAMAPDVTAQFDHGVSVVDMLRRATGRIESSFAGKPELEALARETIGTTLLGLDAIDDAIEQFRKALAVRRDILVDDHPEVHRSKLHVAVALYAGYRINDAQEVAEEALAALERLHGTDHPLTLSAASLRGSIYSEQGEMARADSLFEITLERQRRVLGSEHRDTIATLLAWAGAYCWRGRQAEAAREATRLGGEAYETARRICSPDDAIVLEAERVYGLALAFRSQMNRAKEVLRPSIEKCRRVCGETHSATIWAGFSLARALDLPEEQDEKESLYAKMRDANGPSEWVVCRDLGRLMVARGKLEEGLAVLREQHEYWNGSGEEVASHVRRERLGTIQDQAFSNYRHALAHSGRWQEVRALVTQRIEQLRASAIEPGAGPGEWNGYAWLLLTCEPEDLRDPEEALVWATRAVEHHEELDQVELGLVLDTQAKAYEMVGDPGRAIDAQRRSVEAVVGVGNEVATAYLMAQLVRYVSQAADGSGTVEAANERMDSFIDSLEEGTERAVDAPRLLGRDLARRGLHSWADELFRRAIENARALSDKLPLLRSLIACGSSRARAGDMEEARTLLNEAGDLYGELFAGEPIDWRPGIGYDDAGERSPDAVTAKNNLALAMIDAALLEQAEELTRQVRAVNPGRARYATGRLLRREGDVAAAEPLLRHALFSDRWMVEDEPYRFARREIEYGQCLIELGRHAEAEELLALAHARALEWGGPHSNDAKLAAERLEQLRRVRGQASAAPGLAN